MKLKTVFLVFALCVVVFGQNAMTTVPALQVVEPPDVVLRVHHSTESLVRLAFACGYADGLSTAINSFADDKTKEVMLKSTAEITGAVDCKRIKVWAKQ